MGGSLTIFSATSVAPLWVAGGEYIDILLGPERTRECFLSRQETYNIWTWSYRGRPVTGVRLVPHEFGCCVLFENCTVDASIFVVSNEERTVDALAPGADEGRRRLR